MAEHRSPARDGESSPRFETSDAQVRPFAVTGLVLVALMAASILGMVVLFKVFNYYQPQFDDPVPPLAQTRQFPATPRLQVDPPRQKLELRQYEEDILTTYAWADVDARRVRIPVQRAIDLVSEGRLSLIPPSSSTPYKPSGNGR